MSLAQKLTEKLPLLLNYITNCDLLRVGQRSCCQMKGDMNSYKAYLGPLVSK